MEANGADRIAKVFSRLGWIGLWVQAILAIIPIGMLCYVIFGKVSGQRDTFDFLDYLAFAGLGILAFTTFWSFRYVLLARRIADPSRRPQRAAITRVLWVGIWASSVGIAISLLLLFIDIIRLLFLFLSAPQGGVPVIQTQPEARTQWVSAIDAVSLLAEVCTLAGELLILGFTLWLLFRVMQLGDEYDQSVAVPSE